MSCCVILCRTMQGQKYVQEDKKNKRWIDLEGRGGWGGVFRVSPGVLVKVL